jgi:hypothetical protein
MSGGAMDLYLGADAIYEALAPTEAEHAAWVVAQ